MRKKSKKLALSKETLRNLMDREIKEVAGGAHTASLCAKVCDSMWDCSYTCSPTCPR
jgi:hypothetical protein